MDYQDAFDSLAEVYLEDSWVLELAPRERGLAFRLETVLTPRHELSASPRPGDQHCYRAAWLDVTSEDLVALTLSGAKPATDASGSVDYGNIDSFVSDDGVTWVLEGDWGRAQVLSPKVAVTFD